MFITVAYSKDGNTPLILATQGKHIDTMSTLLENNADVTICNKVCMCICYPFFPIIPYR